MEHSVALVVDPSFGERLLTLATAMHVWAVDSEENRQAAERYWADEPDDDLETGITLFEVAGEVDARAALAAVLGDIELHHGPPSHDPPVSVLEVFGATSLELMRDVLSGAGFAVVESDGEGLRAIRSGPATE